ncbi:Serine/arginine repetitive matrix protein 1 [Apophysomyces ossiformis]|uniref:Serine/arginine repetitive matrix protein 1 n=1 Tax=Apophysomyces ossiformis TaxID=679940 RepID=A0A8H7ESQ9_9FUNG|nr:Serine/arginine repetitive matrix protein 1 [Apophysomyces ossiformis]
MGDAGFFKGTSSDQDTRFSNKQKKLLQSMKFPPEFDKKVSFNLCTLQVDIKKVNLDVIKPWISNRITQLLGFEDEVVIDFTFGLLEEANPDPKMMQINLTGFLEKNTQSFILELWKLLLSAQDAVGGIPKEFLEQKKEELRQKKEHEALLKARQNAVMEAIRKRKELELKEQRENETREPGRRSRYGARSQSRSRSRSPNRSVSPPRQRSRERKRFPGVDSYNKLKLCRVIIPEREVEHLHLVDIDHVRLIGDLTVMIVMAVIAPMTVVREMIIAVAVGIGIVDDVIGRGQFRNRGHEEEAEAGVVDDTVEAQVLKREDTVEVLANHVAKTEGGSQRMMVM